MTNRSGSVQLASICQPRRAAVRNARQVERPRPRRRPGRSRRRRLRPAARPGRGRAPSPALIASAPTGGPRAGPAARWSASIQRASSTKTTVMTTRIAASTPARACRPRPWRAAKASWRIASRPTASGRIEMASAPSEAQAADREVQAGHEVDRLDAAAAVRCQASRPHIRNRLARHMPKPVQGGQREQEHGRAAGSHWSTAKWTPNSDAADEQHDAARGPRSSAGRRRPCPRRTAIMSIGAVK